MTEFRAIVRTRIESYGSERLSRRTTRSAHDSRCRASSTRVRPPAGPSLIPAPPWFYSGDLLTVEYRTDPARVAELLPAPLELADEDPGAVALIWADWQSCSSSREELLDPVRSQYKEAFVVVRCSYEGQTYSRCVYIWVDKDFAIGRGIHQGYPKKLGSMWQTRPHPSPRRRPQIAAGWHVRCDPRGGRPAPGGRRTHPARGVRAQRLRQRAPDGPPPRPPRHRRGAGTPTPS